MTKQYFRVLQFHHPNQNDEDTLLNNYGNSFDTAHYHHFMEVYSRTMAQINLPVDFLISVNNQIYMNGEIYMDILNKAVDDKGILHLFKVTNNPKHLGFAMPLDLIFDFLQSFDEENQFIFFDNGTILWEHYLEKVRREEFNHLPARQQSVFFFDDLNNCEAYKRKHLSGIGSTYKVEILDQTAFFEGDMNIIDEIENSISRDDLIKQIRKYWRGKNRKPN